MSGRAVRVAVRTFPGVVLALAGSVLLVAPADSAAQAADSADARRAFVEELGCSGCHGTGGEGGLGPALADTELSLATFVKQVRLPEGTMPPFSPLVASDDELLAVYEWIGGGDPVATPPAVEVDFEGLSDWGNGDGAAVVELQRLADGPPPDQRLHLRATLLALDNAPLAEHPLEVRAPGAEEWSPARTDAEGRVTAGPEEGVAAADLLGGDDSGVFGLRAELPPGEYALVVEVLQAGSGDAPTVGMGSRAFEVP